MKYRHYLILLSFFISIVGYGKDWALINSNKISYYKHVTGEIQFLQISSTKVFNQDTLYYPKRLASKTYYSGILDYELSWVGNHYIKMKNNWDVLITCHNRQTSISGVNGIIDSIYIKRNTFIGDSWRFTSTISGNYLASVTGLGMETFLGISDSVKTIFVTSPNSTFTGTIKVSKTYGLIQILSMNCFPDMKPLTICGIKGIAGFKDFRGREIFNFQVGDEFQYYYHENYWNTKPKYKYIFLKVISKDTTGNFMTYTFFNKNYNGTVTGQNSEVNSIDSTIILTKYSKNDTLSRDFPNSISCNSFYGNYYLITDSTKYIDNSFIDYSYNVDYKKNIGITKEYGGGMGGGFSKRLIYYKKDSYTSGTKQDFVITSTENTLDIQSINISPNPTTGIFTISTTANEPLTISVSNIMGHEVYQAPLNLSTLEINLAQKPKGIYFVKVSTQGKIAAYYKLVVQ